MHPLRIKTTSFLRMEDFRFALFPPLRCRQTMSRHSLDRATIGLQRLQCHPGILTCVAAHTVHTEVTQFRTYNLRNMYKACFQAPAKAAPCPEKIRAARIPLSVSRPLSTFLGTSQKLPRCQKKTRQGTLRKLLRTLRLISLRL